MRKHLLGFALFALIVSSFAVIGIFVAPFAIPEVPRECPNNVLFKVTSSYYDLESGDFITDLKVVWDGTGARPDSVWVWQEFVGDDSTLIAAGLERIQSPFAVGNTASVVIRSGHVRSPNADANLYGRFEVAASQEEMRTGLDVSRVSPPQQVVFIHGTNPLFKK